MTDLEYIKPDECLEWRPYGQPHPDGACAGRVEYRYALSASGKSFPRCASHWAKRLKEQERIDGLYGGLHDQGPAPADFDPSYAGERWSEDDF